MRTKLILHISTFTLLTMLFMGCSVDIESLMPDSKSSLKIAVVFDDITTRAAIIPGEGFDDGTSIDIVLKNENTSESGYNGSGNGTKKKFTFDKNTAIWSTTPAYTLTSQRGVITAFYPSGLTSPVLADDIKTLTPKILDNATIDLSTIPVIALDASTPIKIASTEIDYMIGKGTPVSDKDPASNVQMNHVLAMVAVQLNIDGSYPDPGQLTKIEFANQSNSKDDAILLNGTVDVATGSFNEGSTVASYTRNITNYKTGENLAFLAYPAILYADGLVTLTLTIDGKAYTIPLQGAFDGSRSWEAGQCIIYKVNISGKKISLTGVDIKPWSSGTVINQSIKPNDNSEKVATLTLDENAPGADIPAIGGVYKVKVTSNSDWIALVENCTIDPTFASAGETEVIIKVVPDTFAMPRTIKAEFFTQLVGGKNTSGAWTGSQVIGDPLIKILTTPVELPGEKLKDENEIKYTLNIKGNTPWTATGTNCTLTTAKGDTGSSLLDFTVSEFKTGARDVSITLTSTENPSYSVTWKTVQTSLEIMNIGDIYWLAKNMGGTQGQTSGYGLVAKMTDQGSFFKWGSKYVYDRTSAKYPDAHWGADGTSAAETPTTSGTSQEGYDYAALVSTEVDGNAGDPCSVLGVNFKTPTAKQWKTLLSQNGKFVTIEGVGGMLYGATAGIPSTTLADLPLGCIFFPAGGYRSETDGALTELVGSYLTSSVYDDTHNQAHTFTDKGVVTNSVAVPRGRGQSLRCIYQPQP